LLAVQVVDVAMLLVTRISAALAAPARHRLAMQDKRRWVGFTIVALRG
jgi:hypothetical protein